MGKTKQQLCAAIAFALLLAFATPARPQDNDMGTAGASDEVQAPASSEVESAPDETKAPAAATHHTAKKKSTAHHKHAKKKKAHKTAKKHHAKKPVKKKARTVHHHKVSTKSVSAKPKKDVEQESLPPAKTESEEVKPAALVPAENEAKEEQNQEAVDAEAKPNEESAKPAVAEAPPKKSIFKKAMTAAGSVFHRKPKENPAPSAAAIAVPSVGESAHTEKSASASGGKSVTYTFCLGYENCIPHRYEAVMHGGTVDAKIFKETSDRDWTETKLDPVMASDLNTMAHGESGTDVSRPLTVTEKARIADHQGKVHVDLVAAANDGRKEEVKQMLRNLGIKNESDLQTYDDRLAKNNTAITAANELASGR